MQYKVPQNVDIEDKVIAGLTLKQFIYVIVAGGIVLALKYALPPGLSFLFMPLAITIGSAGVGMAFVKINERPLEVFLLSAAKTVLTPNQRTWQKEVDFAETEVVEPKKEEPMVQKQNVSEIRSNLERLAMIVDSGTHGLVEERTTNVKAIDRSGPDRVADILEKTEKPSEKLDRYIQKAKDSVKTQKKEQPISSLSSIDPGATKFEYEQIETTNEKELENIIDKAREEEREKDVRIDSAKINKF